MTTHQENELTRNSSENYRAQLFQLDEPLWTDLGTMSEINVRELISTSTKKDEKKKKNRKKEKQKERKSASGE